jgi:hypothetical protein
MWWKDCYSKGTPRYYRRIIDVVRCGLLVIGVCSVTMPAFAKDDKVPSLAASCHLELASHWENPGAAAEFLDSLPTEVKSSGYCLAARGELYLIKNNDFFALRSLVRAQAVLSSRYGEKHWAMQRVRMLLCLALFRTEQWEEAVHACDGEGAALALAPWLDYYGGLAAFRADDARTAVRRLNRARPALKSTLFSDSLSRFRTYAFGSLARVRPGYELNLGSSAGYDSNALMAPNEPALVGLDEKADSWRSAHWASVRYTSPNAGRVFFGFEGNAGRTFNFTSPADSINATDFGGGLSVRSFGLTGKGRYVLEGKYGYRVTYLDGGPATLRPDLFGFNEAHSLSLGPSFWDASGNGYSVRYSASKQRFAELVRNGWGHNLSVGEELALTDRLSLGLAQSLLMVDSTSAYRRLGGALGTFVAFAPAFRWLVTLRGTVQYENYFSSRGYFSESQRRSDWLYITRLEGRRQVGAGFGLGVYGGVSGRQSTIAPLTYNKWETGLSLTWSNQEL